MKKAFTLIEVMVVLSILAIIAILAYNFFGNTMKDAKLTQAATKIYNDLRVISDAVDKYVGDDPSVFQLHGTIMDDNLVSNGYLKSYPVPDSPIDASAYYRYYWSYEDMGGPTATDDVVIDAYRFPQDVCHKVQELFGVENAAGLPYEWDYGQANGEATTYPHDQSVFCLNWGGSDYSIIYVMDRI